MAASSSADPYRGIGRDPYDFRVGAAGREDAIVTRDIAELVGQLGLGVSLFQPFFDFEAAPDELFAKNLDRAQRKFDLMLELGAPMMLVSSNASAHAIADDARAAAQLRAMAEEAAQRGLKLGYEAVAWGTHAWAWVSGLMGIGDSAGPHFGFAPALSVTCWLVEM